MDSENPTDDFLSEPVYTIGHAAEKLGVAVPTIRMYEQAGLILPYRTKTNRRLYSRTDIHRIEVIIDLIRNYGLILESIRRLCSLIPCWQITQCSEEMRNGCPAYNDSNNPCWVEENTNCRKEGLDCRRCKVYIDCPQSWKNPKEFLKSFFKN
ncbi:hypothetical protein A2V82_08630 [candidate division KSB1 bacterium RBG_16_48_16]|nr:MAG: hypothetical protein A2V82_08630 [candidate division KSB1 bacterium RBG_16_48_16]